MAYRNYSPLNGFIVSQDGTGDFTTIQAAINAATAQTTIYINDGNYTEDLTLKNLVNLASLSSHVAYVASGTINTGSVKIIGKAQDNGVQAICNIQGISFQTNNDYILYLTTDSYINYYNCVFYVPDHDAIFSSAVGSNITIRMCTAGLVQGDFAFFICTNTSIWMSNTQIVEIFSIPPSGVPNILTNCNLQLYDVFLECGFSITNSSIQANFCEIDTRNSGTPCLIINTGTVDLNYCALYSGTSYAIYNSGTLIPTCLSLDSNHPLYAIDNAGGLIQLNEIIYTGTQTIIQDSGSISAEPVTIGDLTLLNPLSHLYGGTGLSAPGIAGNVLTSNGSSWVSSSAGASGGGGVINDIAVNTAASVNTTYNATAALTVTLPASPAQSDTIQIICSHAGPIVVDANTGQTIKIGSNNSTSSGTATNVALGDVLTLRFLSASTTWRSVSSMGNWVLA